MADYRARFRGREGVVVIGVAHEKMRSFKAHKRCGRATKIMFDFSRQPVAINHYYFYLQDRDWGPAFLKIGTYLPYPVKLCLNGHEWVKQQRLTRAHVRFATLDNGLLTCANPVALQTACDSLGPTDVQAFFDRWSYRLPWPMTPRDRAACYDHRLAICQLEVSVTHVFDRPVYGRHFFEAVIGENLDLGRPDRVGLLFPLRITRATPPPAWGYRTRVITDGVQPSLHIADKSSHVKQYFKEQRALRTKTTINNPKDFYFNKGVDNLAHLRDLGQGVNRKLLEVERLSQHCVLTQDALDRLQQPTVEAGQRVSALRFGDPRVMAILQALTAFTHLPRGFPQRRPSPARGGVTRTRLSPIADDLRSPAPPAQGADSSDRRHPSLHATTYGLKVAFFYSKLYLRLLRPNWPALLPVDDALPRPLRSRISTPKSADSTRKPPSPLENLLQSLRCPA